MSAQNLFFSDVVSRYHVNDQVTIQELLTAEVTKNNHQLIVLDDDPTGTQSVHGVFVYTKWDEATLEAAFNSKEKLFYILTNSRSLSEAETAALHQEIGATIATIAKRNGQPFLLISRSDSTLRGHFPLETATLKMAIESQLALSYDGEILCPFFEAGGRYTVDDTHYLKNNERLIPVAQTEFAQDPNFAYRSSNLKAYVAEKTKGEFKEDAVVSITLAEIRALDYRSIEAKLLTVTDFNKVLINALDLSDLQVVVTAIYRTIQKGKKFLFRTGADFVKVIGDVSPQALLTPEEMTVKSNNHGGLTIVGSYTRKTTTQLNALLTLEEIQGIAFHSELVTDDERFQQEIKRVNQVIVANISVGQHVVVYTNRTLLAREEDTQTDRLRRSLKISAALQSFVANLPIEPSYIVAKGGITSSDIATKALHIEKAKVLGQVQPSVPVWLTGCESKFPGTAYVIFPGNVGETATLKKVIEALNAKRKLGKFDDIK